jgi:capsule polysaccharide modification protein KpsS
MDTYYKSIVLEVRKHTDRPIVIRSHPRYREKIFFNIDEAFYKAYNVEWNIPKKVHQTYDSFDLDNLLAHCHCVISHSSNSGVAAVLAGTPVIVSEDSLAYEMGASKIADINHLPKPDRSQWLIELAHKEWFPHELGQAWRGLRAKLLP